MLHAVNKLTTEEKSVYEMFKKIYISQLNILNNEEFNEQQTYMSAQKGSSVCVTKKSPTCCREKEVITNKIKEALGV